MNGAEEATTATGEAGQPHLLLADQTTVLLLLPVLLAVLVVLAGGGGPLVLPSVSRRGQAGHSGLGSGQAGGRAGRQDLLFTET